MFEHLCQEKSGAIWRAVRIPAPSIEWAMHTVDKLQQVPNFLPEDNSYAILLNPQNKFFQVDNVGLIGVFPTLEYPQLLHVHITFWDGRLRGREGLCRSLAMWVSRFSDKLLFTQIPEDRPAVLAFARRVGFEPQAEVGSSKTLLFTNYTG